MPEPRTYSVAIIGHTGVGNFGHHLDEAAAAHPRLKVCGVADADPDGLQAALQRTAGPRGYSDYHEMLAAEQPEIVVVAPRAITERMDMVSAALAAGAHMMIEKPLAASYVDARRLHAAGRAAGRKIVVAHQGHLHPATDHAVRLVNEGVIGRLRQVRGTGKMDSRGGEEDMIVLGSHVFELMHLFGGRPRWVTGELLRESEPVTDGTPPLRTARDGIGTVASDGARATFGFGGGVVGLFESFRDLGDGEELFGVELVGETGRLALFGGVQKRLYRYPRPYVSPGLSYRWERVPVPNALPGEVDDGAENPGFGIGNRRILDDLLSAIESGDDPRMGSEEALRAVEMIEAVRLAHRLGRRIDIPFDADIR